MRNKLIIAILFSLLAFTTIVYATDTPEPTPTATVTATYEATVEVTPEVPVDEPTIPDGRVDHNIAVTFVINNIVGLILGAFGSAPVTLVIVALLKKVPSLDHILAKDLTFVTAAVLYVGGLGASYFGQQVAFESLLEFIVVAAPAVVSFIATLTGATAQYHITKGLKVPVVGESRYNG